MLEYSITEAEALLSKNLNAAQKSLAEIEEDLGFLRDQYTTTEVSILEHFMKIGFFSSLTENQLTTFGNTI